MKKLLFPLLLCITLSATAQKKPLDHTVYDGWKSIGERMISNDGAFVVYTVNPQEGDGELVIQNPHTRYKKVVARGYNAVISEDSRFLIFRIKPYFQETRQAKIKKKKADEMPKDSLAIIELGRDSITKISGIKSFKTPERGSGFVAFLMDKAVPDTVQKNTVVDSARLNKEQLLKLADSLIGRSIDSINGKISKEALSAIINKTVSQIVKKGSRDNTDAEADDVTAGNGTSGTRLVLRNLSANQETVFNLVNEYYFDKNGTRLLIETTRNSKDSNSKALLLLYNLQTKQTDTILKAFNDAKGYVFDEDGNQLAFMAERDSSEKALTRFYKLWYFKTGQDSARLIAEKNTVGMRLGYTVSENGNLSFSKDGSKLYLGTAPVPIAKDTTIIDFETAKLDIWNYKDDYLQSQQLKNLDAELKRTYTAVYHVNEDKLVQLGAEDAEDITTVNEGNAGWVLGESNKGNRIDAQWAGRTRSSAWVINTATGERKTVFSNLFANAAPSPSGKFVYWYNPELKNYFTYEIATGITRNVSDKIKVPLYDEENDVPDFAEEYKTMGWSKDDSFLMIYDKYEVWKLNPSNKSIPVLFFDKTVQARQNRITYRYIKTNKEEKYIPLGEQLVFKAFDNKLKLSSYKISTIDSSCNFLEKTLDSFAYNNLFKAKAAMNFVFTKESFKSSPDLYYAGAVTEIYKRNYETPELADTLFANTNFNERSTRLSDINPQQKDYNWGTATLYNWKAYNGKPATGIVYKPENFDPKKKYPLICYFYEKLSDGLNSYIAPAPTPSRLNISFFVSRGYIVLAPDIVYNNGHPGNSAYDYIVSGARALVKYGMADSSRIGIQGQSWGGYQVAYLITRTKLFKAAWAGAPVANMTSAYGGIRWESGLNRQFQYEKQQSRIGATLWEKPELYIENSPLFHLPTVQTPLVIMSNDADGAVPWYQGIELFTALRRLGKPVWMLNYNNEAHNLMERKNRKDIQVREQQFFDWQLKGDKPAKWLTEGIPATQKGKDWGLEIE